MSIIDYFQLLVNSRHLPMLEILLINFLIKGLIHQPRTQTMQNPMIDHAVILLNGYSFDLDGYTAEQLVDGWADYYKPHWVKLAVIEALYQGRYKAISVAQILAFWERRGEPLCHFNQEFEQIVCDHFIPCSLTTPIAGMPNQPDPSVTSQAEAIVPNPTEPLELTDDQPIQDVDTGAAQPTEVDNPTPAQTPITYHPIHQFVPPTDASEFYSKLKAVASAMKD